MDVSEPKYYQACVHVIVTVQYVVVARLAVARSHLKRMSI